MAGLKRTVHLTVSDKETGAVLLADGLLRIDFTVETTLGGGVDVAKFEVYNLADKTIRMLSSPTSKAVTLKVSSPYSKTLSVLFEGELINIHHAISFQDSITSIWCWKKGQAEGKKPIQSLSIEGNPTVKNVVDALVAGIVDKQGNTIYKAIWTAVPEPTQETPVRSMSFNKTYFEAINQVLKEVGLSYTIADGYINICPIPSKEGDINTIQPSAITHSIIPIFLKKPIELGVAEVTIHYSLSGHILPTHIVHLVPNPKLQTSLAGYDQDALSLVSNFTAILPSDYYFVSNVIHRGSAYTNDWDTVIQGFYYAGGRSR